MYLTVPELASAVTSLSAAYPGISQAIDVPYSTHEGRASQVLRVGVQPTSAADGLLILGGVHAREWIPPDLCISLAADLLEAYDGGTGLIYGGATFSAAEIKKLLHTVNLYFFPCVNPDGRSFSQSGDANWRKNRRPAPGGGGPSCVGVDINRNFDFLWDHTARFAADAGVRTSADPCNYQTYRGPSAASEPETRNVVWVLDNIPRIRWLVDVHSAVPVVLHSWGDDSNQSTVPADNFRNTALDAVRGRLGDGIGEYLSGRDQLVATDLAGRLRDGVLTVRGADYPVEQAMTLYPTSGASDDYAFSRHFADPAKTKVFGWTVECGTSFQPAFSEAAEVIRETSAGLLRFALGLHEVTDGLLVDLRTPALSFSDTPEGGTTEAAVVFDCAGDLEIHLDVTAGPSGGFHTPAGPSVAVPPPGFGVTTQGWVPITYTAGPAGTSATGSVTVRCRETTEEFVIALSANSVGPPLVGPADADCGTNPVAQPAT